MKTIFYVGSFLLLLLGSNVMAQEEKNSIRVKITDENGKVIEKEYDSAEAFENDPELKEMGVEVEAEEGQVRVKSKGNGNQSVVIQQNSGNGNYMHIQQGPNFGSGADSLRRPPHPPVGMNDPNSYEREEHLRRLQMRDSLLSHRQEQMEERMKEMEERRVEMRRRMEERREGHRGHRKNNQLIIIENLSKKDAARLGIKNDKLGLEDLHILPDPDEKTLELGFLAPGNDPVQIKLSDAENRLLLDETHTPVNNKFEKAFDLEDFGKGFYILQITQDKKSLSRKIRIE